MSECWFKCGFALKHPVGSDLYLYFPELPRRFEIKAIATEGVSLKNPLPCCIGRGQRSVLVPNII